MKLDDVSPISGPPHEVFCDMASPLAYFTDEAAVLYLCQNQDRESGQRHLSFRTYCRSARKVLEGWQHVTPMGMVVATGREPTRYHLACMYFYELPRPLLNICFGIWQASFDEDMRRREYGHARLRRAWFRSFRNTPTHKS